MPRPGYVITDDERFFPVRLDGRVIATLSRPLSWVADRRWCLADTNGTVLAWWDRRPMRSDVNARLAAAGLWSAEGGAA